MAHEITCINDDHEHLVEAEADGSEPGDLLSVAECR